MTYFELFYFIFELASYAAILFIFGIFLFLKLKYEIFPKVLLYILGGVSVVVLLVFSGMFFWNYWENPVENLADISGEYWSIEEVFLEEKNIPLRVFKRELLVELWDGLMNYRRSKNLLEFDLKTIKSYSPTKLSMLLEKKPEKFLLLDVRELHESDSFSLNNTVKFRYGDLANDIFPDKKLWENKTVVVTCYSGIRGYLVANLLHDVGIENVAFIRGGLGRWVKEGFVVEGSDDDFKFMQDTHARLKLKNIDKDKFIFIDVSSDNLEDIAEKVDEAEYFFFELATSMAIEQKIQEIIRKNKPVVFVCHTESQCYDAGNFLYLLEKRGVEISGYLELR